jgi:hypothetical protein
LGDLEVACAFPELVTQKLKAFRRSRSQGKSLAGGCAWDSAANKERAEQSTNSEGQGQRLERLSANRFAQIAGSVDGPSLYTIGAPSGNLVDVTGRVFRQRKRPFGKAFSGVQRVAVFVVCRVAQIIGQRANILLQSPKISAQLRQTRLNRIAAGLLLF